jgi:hypothetical protein
VNDELQRIRKKQLWPDCKAYPDISLEGLRKTKKNLNHNSQSLSQDLNPGPPKYEGVLKHLSIMFSVFSPKNRPIRIMYLFSVYYISHLNDFLLTTCRF